MTAETMLPIFPLGLVLLPTMQLPLHIFEERYKLMISESIQSKSEVGIVFFSGDKIQTAGCAARLVEITRQFADGRMDITVRGTRRFEMTQLYDHKPYLEANVVFFDDEPVSNPSAVAHLSQKAVELLARMRRFLPEKTGELLPGNADPLYVSFQLAANEGFSHPERQHFLELRSTADRLERGVKALAKIVARLKISAEINRIIQSNGNAGNYFTG